MKRKMKRFIRSAVAIVLVTCMFLPLTAVNTHAEVFYLQTGDVCFRQLQLRYQCIVYVSVVTGVKSYVKIPRNVIYIEPDIRMTPRLTVDA